MIAGLLFVVVPAARRLQQHPERHVDVDPPVFQEVGGVAGTVYALHPNALFHETGSVPVRTGGSGGWEIPGFFISLRLHDRLFVKGNRSKTYDRLIAIDD